jgi:hypothetical protein
MANSGPGDWPPPQTTRKFTALPTPEPEPARQPPYYLNGYEHEGYANENYAHEGYDPYATDEFSPFSPDASYQPHADRWDPPHAADRWDPPHAADRWDPPHAADRWDPPPPADPWDLPHTGYAFPAEPGYAVPAEPGYARRPDPWDRTPDRRPARDDNRNTRTLWLIAMAFAAVVVTVLVFRWFGGVR